MINYTFNYIFPKAATYKLFKNSLKWPKIKKAYLFFFKIKNAFKTTKNCYHFKIYFNHNNRLLKISIKNVRIDVSHFLWGIGLIYL